MKGNEMPLDVQVKVLKNIVKGLRESVFNYQCRIVEVEMKLEDEHTFHVEPCHDGEYNGIKCLESNTQYGFFKSDADYRPGYAIWVDKDDVSRLFSLFKESNNGD